MDSWVPPGITSRYKRHFSFTGSHPRCPIYGFCKLLNLHTQTVPIPRHRHLAGPGGLRGRHQDRADAARHGSPTLKNPIQNDYGPYVLDRSRHRSYCPCDPSLENTMGLYYHTHLGHRGGRQPTSSSPCAGVVAAFVAAVCGCGLSNSRPVFNCPKDTVPCGNGCIPPTGVCCDDGTGKTSSYCTNQATGCFVNDRGCQAVFPSGTTGKYCCGTAGSIGSNDCPEGQHHCGLLCQSQDRPCCADNASSADCPTMSWDPSGCTSAKAGYLGCGVCRATKSCIACAPGDCCSGDPCGNMACIASSACTGGGVGGTPSTCTFTKAACCDGSPGISAVQCAVYTTYVQQCGCPTGTTKGGANSDGTTWCICP